MKSLYFALICWFGVIGGAVADYQRNQAVPVEKVLFGNVISVRNITEHELIEDRNQGWKTFGGALIGGAIGHQFGSGSGQDVATILGALIGGSIAHDRNPMYQQKTLRLVELMIEVENGDQYMVVQDFDAAMIFRQQDEVRIIYLASGLVRVDKQM